MINWICTYLVFAAVVYFDSKIFAFFIGISKKHKFFLPDVLLNVGYR